MQVEYNEFIEPVSTGKMRKVNFLINIINIINKNNKSMLYTCNQNIEIKKPSVVKLRVEDLFLQHISRQALNLTSSTTRTSSRRSTTRSSSSRRRKALLHDF